MPRPTSPRDGDESPPTQTAELDSSNRFVIGLDCRSMNLYRFLRVRFPRARRSLLRQWLDEGKVTLNGSPHRTLEPLRAGDVVEIAANVEQLPRPTRAKLVVLHEDRHVLVLDKPAMVATAPERSRARSSLLELLRERSGTSAEHGIKLVHRLDKGASGVVVFAKGRPAKRFLIEEFTERRVVKDYLALVVGEWRGGARIERSSLAPVTARNPRMRVVRSGGKEAVTALRGLFGARGFSVVHARPITGRTHQIRVQLAELGHPLVGDTLYGGPGSLRLSALKPGFRPSRGERERPLLERLALHSSAIRMATPDGSTLDARAPLPKDLRSACRQLWKSCGRPDGDFEAWQADPCGLEESDPWPELAGP